MTTVGYGDGFPNTYHGRGLIIIACVIGMMVVSLMVVTLTIHSEFSAAENKAFCVLRRMNARETAKISAKQVIK